MRYGKWFGLVGIALLCSLGFGGLILAQPSLPPFVGLESVYHWEFVGTFRDKVVDESVSVSLLAIATYQVIGLGAEGFSCSIALDGSVDWPAQSSDHWLSLVSVLTTDGQENQTIVNPYDGFAYSQYLILHSLGSVVASEGPNYVRMVLLPLNFTELIGFSFSQELLGEQSMYFVHDVNAGVGEVVQIWMGVHGEVVSRDDVETRVGVLSALHITWSRTWTTFSPLSDDSQTLHFVYDQQTGFLISASISGSVEWDVAEMVWNQTGSIESTNMHLPRLGFPSPFLLIVVCVSIVLPVIFLVLALNIYRRYLR